MGYRHILLSKRYFMESWRWERGLMEEVYYEGIVVDAIVVGNWKLCGMLSGRPDVGVEECYKDCGCTRHYNSCRSNILNFSSYNYIHSLLTQKLLLWRHNNHYPIHNGQRNVIVVVPATIVGVWWPYFNSMNMTKEYEKATFVRMHLVTRLRWRCVWKPYQLQLSFKFGMLSWQHRVRRIMHSWYIYICSS